METQMIMMDLETMSTLPNAAIASIGAVKFDSASGEIGETFYQTVDLKDCKRLGMDFSKETLAWWSKQSKEARAHLLINTVSVEEALSRFSTWYGKISRPTWGCGSDFDNVIMQSAYRAIDMKCPWKYYHNRCYRTLRETMGIREIKRDGVHHNALDDAMNQTKQLIAILGS